MLRVTPFHSRTGPLCQASNWRRWAGYVAASSYDLSHLPEYHAIRTAAALIDVSPLFKYRITGRDAERLADRVVTRDVGRCDVGQVLYTPWCDEDGKVRDDGTLQRLDESDFRLTAAEPNLRWLQDNAFGMEVEIRDESDRLAALALQGPMSRDVLGLTAEAEIDDLGFFRLTRGRVRGVDVLISRTGYTGDLGYELWVEPEGAENVWDALVETGRDYGLMPAGMLALDMARIEAGLILVDVDYVPAHHAVIESRKSSPYELGLGWTVKLDGGPFVGRSALRREAGSGSGWRLSGLAIDWESLETLYGAEGLPPQLPAEAWRTSVPCYAAGKQVGYATSGSWSPLLKQYLALAHLREPFAEAGSEVAIEVTVEHQRRQARARVVRTPFFDPPRKRG